MLLKGPEVVAGLKRRCQDSKDSKDSKGQKGDIFTCSMAFRPFRPRHQNHQPDQPALCRAAGNKSTSCWNKKLPFSYALRKEQKSGWHILQTCHFFRFWPSSSNAVLSPQLFVMDGAITFGETAECIRWEVFQVCDLLLSAEWNCCHTFARMYVRMFARKYLIIISNNNDNSRYYL